MGDLLIMRMPKPPKRVPGQKSLRLKMPSRPARKNVIRFPGDGRPQPIDRFERLWRAAEKDGGEDR